MFVEGRFGRRAQVAGTGLDVWRIVELLEQYGNVAAVCERFPLISEGQIADPYAGMGASWLPILAQPRSETCSYHSSMTQSTRWVRAAIRSP
jgi:hypothetical protein